MRSPSKLRHQEVALLTNEIRELAQCVTFLVTHTNLTHPTRLLSVWRIYYRAAQCAITLNEIARTKSALLWKHGLRLLLACVGFKFRFPHFPSDSNLTKKKHFISGKCVRVTNWKLGILLQRQNQETRIKCSFLTFTNIPRFQSFSSFLEEIGESGNQDEDWTEDGHGIGTVTGGVAESSGALSTVSSVHAVTGSTSSVIQGSGISGVVAGSTERGKGVLMAFL